MKTRYQIKAKIDQYLEIRLADGNPESHALDRAIAALAWVLGDGEEEK